MSLAYLRRPRRSVVAALVVAGVFFGGFTLLERMQAQGAPLPGTAVVVATRDIAAGETLTRDMVSVELAPAGSPLGGQPALATDLPRVLGSWALAPILAGEPVSRARLAGSDASDNPVVAAAAIPRGYARYTVPVGALAEPLPGLSPGDTVEVLAALPRDPAVPAVTAEVQPVDPHALVAYVGDQPPAVTLVVPRRELATLAWLRGQGASFSFAVVDVSDRSADMHGVGPREFKELYHVPAD